MQSSAFLAMLRRHFDLESLVMGEVVFRFFLAGMEMPVHYLFAVSVLWWEIRV